MFNLIVIFRWFSLFLYYLDEMVYAVSINNSIPTNIKLEGGGPGWGGGHLMALPLKKIWVLSKFSLLTQTWVESPVNVHYVNNKKEIRRILISWGGER